MEKEKMYMNTKTGEVDSYFGWWYNDEDGEVLNAVERREVVQVEKIDGEWVAVDEIEK